MEKSVTFTSGNKTEALSVIRESARWLINSGKPLWRIEDLTENNPQYGDYKFYVAWLGNESVGAFMLNFDGGFIWQGFPGSAGYIHKLSVRRKFAGKGYSQLLLEYAADICREKSDIAYLRLDCDLYREKLCRLYESCGFELVVTKSFDTEKYGRVDCALYQKEI